jgi:HAMP domain-containing protein
VAVVVGESLEQRDDALDSLAALLLIAGPLGLALTGIAGYLVTAAALRPVERMRARAAAISAGAEGGRMPEPQGDDELARLARTLNEMLARLEAHSTASARSSPTPRTSCARRWRSCAPSSSSRCAARRASTSSRARCARRPRRPTACRSSPRTCW